MDIWVLVIILLVIALILLVASFYAKDNQKLNELINDLQVQQVQEIYQIKARLTEVENELRQPSVLLYGESQDSEAAFVEEVDASEVSDLTREEVIRLYSQGFTMEEIGKDVVLHPVTVQKIVDDYIESR